MLLGEVAFLAEENSIVTTLALGLRPRQRLAKLQAKKMPGSVGKCEGMNPHTSKGAFTLRVKVLVDF
jgi:hypothetical protein